MQGNNSQNRAIIAVHTKLPNGNYLGIVELVQYGFRLVEVAIATGVEHFPSCPYMASISTDDTFVEFRKGRFPLMNVNEWEPIEHYYC